MVWVLQLDQDVMRWFAGHRTAGLTRWMLHITDAHDTGPIVALGLVFALVLVCMRRWNWLLRLVLVLPLGMLVNVGLKQIFQRDRPELEEPLVMLASYSFPSGHTAAATLFYGVLAAFFASQTQRLIWRMALVAAAVFMVLLVATTRMYLGAHYFSDVVAAAACSTGWLVLCLALVAGVEKNR